MTITRETLELAALAIGETIECTEAELNGCELHSTLYPGVMLRGVQVAWRPSTDIGDAARLAVRLGIRVTPPKYKGDGSSAEPTRGNTASCTAFRADPVEQTCIAITLCAAEIGRGMKEMNHGPA